MSNWAFIEVEMLLELDDDDEFSLEFAALKILFEEDRDKKLELPKGLEVAMLPSEVGGEDPSSLRLTICCIRARVPPESTCNITQMVSVRKNYYLHWCKNLKNASFKIRKVNTTWLND